MARGPTHGHSSQGQDWPSLEQQLRETHAEPGSAFEELIRRNQDFSLLKGDDPTTAAGIPPWLRVYWRRAHPDSKGYPLTIRRIQGWLVHNQNNEKVRAMVSESR